MKKALAVALLIAFGLSAQSGASTPAKSYALGKAKKCRVLYVKQTERHRVNGKSVRYIACVYRPPAPPPTTTTTTTLPPGPVVPMVANVLDGKLFGDTFAILFNGLPSPPNVDAVPGDTATLLAFVTAPNVAGTVSFSLNGVPFVGCTAVPVVFNSTPTQSEADCGVQFNVSGPVVLSETFTGSDRSTGSATRTIQVATPDEVAIILHECQELTIGKCS